MADYISKYTGAQIDLAVSSGSTVSGHITASGNLNVGGVISSSGKIYSDDEIHLRDANSSGDTLVKMYASNDDGIVDVYQNNVVKISIDGRGGHITASGDISASGTLTVGAFTLANLTASNDISASGDILAHGKIYSSDEIFLKDGASGGDTLIRGYASGDDGILDVYQNNAVKARINGNGTSHFLGGNVGFGDSVPTKQLQIAGDISMSGDFYSPSAFNFNADISSSGKIYSDDEIHLRDGNAAGDTLVKVYASGDDGIIDVYQNNSVKNRIHGNGASFFNGGSVSASSGLTASAFVSYDDIRLLE